MSFSTSLRVGLSFSQHIEYICFLLPLPGGLDAPIQFHTDLLAKLPRCTEWTQLSSKYKIQPSLWVSFAWTSPSPKNAFIPCLVRTMPPSTSIRTTTPSIESAAASGEIPCFVVTNDVFPMLLHCETDKDRWAVSERKGGWKGWVLPAPLGDSWGVGWGPRASIQESKLLLWQHSAAKLERMPWEGDGAPRCLTTASSTRVRSPAEQSQSQSSAGGGGRRGGGLAHSFCTALGRRGVRHSNKTCPWSCRDTVKTKPRCTKSGHSWRCKNKTLLL